MNHAIITQDHMRLAKEIVGTLRDQVTAPDMQLITCCMVAVIATMATEPVVVIEQALATIAQIHPQLRGPLCEAVLERLTEEIATKEPTRVH